MTKEDEESDNGSGSTEPRNARRPNPIDAHVGSRVRLRRMVMGLSQEKLGELLGLTFQQVQKYEKGVNRIGASRLFDLSHVLGVTVQFFYDDMPNAVGSAAQPGLAERPTEPYVVVDGAGTRDGLELSKAFARISDARVRRALVELAKSLATEPDSGNSST
jgi:transcriptional regulator with XRE-family HTH domain